MKYGGILRFSPSAGGILWKYSVDSVSHFPELAHGPKSQASLYVPC